MPLVKPNFLQARDLLSALIAGGNLDASGQIVWATAVEMAVKSAGTQTWKAFETNGNPNLVNFMASDQGAANYQNEFEDFTMTIRELTPVNGMGTLTALAGIYDYVRVDYIYRLRNLTTGAGVRLVAVGTRGALTNIYSQGENLQSLTIQPCGYGIWVGASTATPPI